MAFIDSEMYAAFVNCLLHRTQIIEMHFIHPQKFQSKYVTTNNTVQRVAHTICIKVKYK